MSLCFLVNQPMGNFSSTNALQKDGFALTGFGGEYSGAYFFKKHIGVGGNIKYTSNTMKDQPVRKLLRDEIPSVIPIENARFEIGLWKQVSLVAGPYFSIPFQNLYLDAFTLIGINFIMPPEMNISAVTDEASYNRSLSVQSVSYALNLGLALRYHLNYKYSLRIFSDYFHSKSKSEIREELDLDGDGTFDTIETARSVPIHSANFGVGLVYRL